jgi:acyl-coenzyme A thioesterase PaaI-like protein
MGDLLALERGMLPFSVTLRTKFLRPLLVGHRYTAEARITRDGDGVVLTEADMSSAAGELHVMATGTYQPIRSEQAQEYMGLDGADYHRLRHYFDHQIGQS